jgi:hypothetical protein
MTFASIKAFLNRNPWTFRALAVLLVFAAGFGTAIVSRPAKVEEKVVTKVDVQTKVEYKDRIVTQKVYVQADKVKKHVETTTTKAVDGTVTTKTTTDESVDEDRKLNASKDEQKQQAVTQVVHEVEYRDKIVTSQPGWDARVGLGVAIPQLLGGPEVGVPGLRGFVVEAGVDRRLAGPFWLGLWGNTQGAAGAELRLTW